jgi:hypothetical protein
MTEPSNIRKATEVEVIIETKPVDNSKAIEVLVQANKQLNNIDYVSKEMVQSFVGAAIRTVYSALDSNNIELAMDTSDKLEVMRRYVQSKLRQSKANMLTYNQIAAGRQRVTREIGKWLEDNFPHGDSNFNKGVPPTGTPMRQDDLDLGVGHNTLAQWRSIANLSDREFEDWIKPFETGINKEGETIDIENMEELYFSRLLTYCQSKFTEKIREPQVNLHPAMKVIYNDLQKLVNDMQTGVQAVSGGNIPLDQIKKVSDYMIKVVNDEITKYLKYVNLSDTRKPWDERVK